MINAVATCPYCSVYRCLAWLTPITLIRHGIMDKLFPLRARNLSRPHGLIFWIDTSLDCLRTKKTIARG